MTKTNLIEVIIKDTGIDPSKQLEKDKSVFDYLNDQTVKYLTKLSAVINALPA